MWTAHTASVGGAGGPAADAGVLPVTSVGMKCVWTRLSPGSGLPPLSGYWGVTRVSGGDHELIEAMLQTGSLLGPGQAGMSLVPRAW